MSVLKTAVKTQINLEFHSRLLVLKEFDFIFKDFGLVSVYPHLHVVTLQGINVVVVVVF